MDIDRATVVRVMKRLRTAVGYHELGMTRHAVQCLDAVLQLGEIGPYRLGEELLRAEFRKSQADYGAAANALENAARMLPSPENQAIWREVSTCYREAGDAGRAVNSMAYARGAVPPKVGHGRTEPGR